MSYKNYLKENVTLLLKSDERIFDFIQEYALDGLWFLDISEQTTFWINPKLKDVLGYKKETENELLEPLFSSILEQIQPLDSSEINEYYHKTFEYNHTNGSKVLMDCKLLNLFDSNGKLYGVLAANTLKKVNDSQVYEQKAILDASMNSQLFYIVRTDIYENYIYANDYFYEIFGYLEKDILGTNARLSIIEEDRDLFIEVVTRCFQYPSVPHQVILRKINQAGKYITNQCEYTGLVDGDGNVFEILCKGINISEEININNNLSLLSMLLTNMTDLLISIDRNGSISYVSPNIRNIYGLDPTKVIGNQYLDFVYSKDVALAKELIENTFSTGISLKNIEFRFTTNSVDWHWANINSSINPENKELILVISDITEKVNYLKQIKKDKLFILESSRVAKVGGWEIDIKSFTNKWSEITKEIHEVPADYVPNIETGINFYKEGESRETIARVVERTINYGEPFDVELQIVTAKGREKWVRAIGSADFSNPDKKRVYGVFQDIDETKRLSLENAKVNTFLKNISLQVSGVLHITQILNNGEWSILFFSKNFLKIDGFDDLSPSEKFMAFQKCIHPDDLEELNTKSRISINNFSELDFTFRLCLSDGEERWVQSTASPERNENGILWYGYMKDITKSKLTELELVRTKKLLQETNQIAKIGGWERNLSTGKVHISDYSKYIFGFNKHSQPSVETIISYFKEGTNRNAISNALKLCNIEGQSFNLELEMTNANEEDIWVRVIGQADFNDPNNKRIYGSIQDITALKLIELAHKKANIMLNTLSEQVPGALYQLEICDDGNSNILYFSNDFFKIEGFDTLSPREKSKVFLKTIHPEDLGLVTKDILRATKQLSAFEYEYRICLKTGEERWVRSMANPERTKDSVIFHGYLYDVTELKTLEIEREKAGYLLTKLSDQIPGVLFQHNISPDGELSIAYFSKNFASLMGGGFKEEDSLYNSALTLPRVHPDDLIHFQDIISNEYQPTENKVLYYRIITPFNGIRWIRSETSNAFRNGNIEWYSYLTDVTEEKNLTLEIQRIQKLLEESSKVARLGGWSMELKDLSIQWSNIVKDIIGVPHEYNPNLEVAVSFYKEGYSRDLVIKSFRECIEWGTPFEIEVEIAKASGEYIWVKVVGSTEKLEDKVVRIFGFFQDINALKLAQINNDKLLATQVLLAKEKELNLIKSRYIALTSHEFRTPLASILGSAELIEMTIEAAENTTFSEKILKHSERIKTQIDRLSSIIKDVLSLEQFGEDKYIRNIDNISIGSFILNVINNSPYEDKVKLILPNEEREIQFDQTSLNHILNNLINNAFKYSRLATQKPEISVVFEDQFCKIMVTDYGIGIPENDQKNIFDTFFRASNSIETEGTGFGLSVAKELAERLGAKITFRSKEGVGSTFTLNIPL